MAINPADIRAVVEKEDDFGHELRVGQILRAHHDGKLLHGGTYVDPITRKPRQYDFRWYYQAKERAISLAVECKNIKTESPVVINCRKRAKIESFHDLVEARTGGRFATKRGPVNIDIASYGVIRTVRGYSSIYQPEDFVGKSMLKIQATQIGKPPKMIYSGDNDTEIHQRWSQALASANDLVLAACESATHEIPHVFTAVLPVVVFPDSTLWKIEYDHKGELITDPIQADECDFYVDREITVPNPFRSLPGRRFVLSHIHFFTMRGFASFLLRIMSDDDWCNSAFDDQILSDARAERLS